MLYIYYTQLLEEHVLEKHVERDGDITPHLYFKNPSKH